MTKVERVSVSPTPGDVKMACGVKYPARVVELLLCLANHWRMSVICNTMNLVYFAIDRLKRLTHVLSNPNRAARKFSVIIHHPLEL